MIQFDLPKQKSSIIKVLGVGGGGSNAVNFMFQQDIEGVDFIICNTDSKAIEQSPVPNKIQLGPHLTQGLGAGADPSVGKLATEESLEEIKKILEVNTKMAFITVGMGGGTGTGAAPIVARVAREMGILTVGVVTKPFDWEGNRRMTHAEAGLAEQQAQAAMTAVGLVRDDAAASLSVMVGFSGTQYLADPWGRPLGTGWTPYGNIALGSGMGRNFGSHIGLGVGMRFPPPTHYRREVSLILRDLKSGQVVYETRASHAGPWSDSVP